MAFWGFSFVWVKIVYYYYNPLTTVFLRISFSAVILLAASYFLKINIKPGAFTNLVPVVTAVTAWFFLPEENISIKTVVGISITIIGIFVAQINRNRNGK